MQGQKTTRLIFMMHVRGQKFGEKQTCLVDFKWKCACYQSNNRSSRLKDWRKALGVESSHPKRLEALGINEKVNKFNLVCCGRARFPYLCKKKNNPKRPLQ